MSIANIVTLVVAFVVLYVTTRVLPNWRWLLILVVCAAVVAAGLARPAWSWFGIEDPAGASRLTIALVAVCKVAVLGIAAGAALLATRVVSVGELLRARALENDDQKPAEPA